MSTYHPSSNSASIVVKDIILRHDSSLTPGVLQSDGTKIITKLLELGVDVSITSPIPALNGGTGSSVLLQNNRVIVSSNGKLVENAALGNDNVVVTNSSGLLTTVLVAPSQLQYLSNVNQDLQSQLDRKSDDIIIRQYIDFKDSTGMTTNGAGNYDCFGDQRVAEKRITLDIKPNFGLSMLRNSVTTQGNGTVTSDTITGQFAVNVSGSSGDIAQLLSANRSSYIPGLSAEVGMVVRTPTSPANGQTAKWGLFDAYNGYYFGRNSTDFFVGIMFNGTETRIYRNMWNVDKLDGSGPSGISMSGVESQLGHIYQIMYAWFGVMSISFRIVVTNISGSTTLQTVHNHKVTSVVSIGNPHLQIGVGLYNTGASSPYSLYLTCRYHAVFGISDERSRTVSHSCNSSISNGWTHIVSMQRKSGFEGVDFRLAGYDVISSVNCIIQVRTGATLSGSYYMTPTDMIESETSVRVIENASVASSTGIVVYSNMASGSTTQNKFTTSSEFNFQAIEQQHITIMCKTVSGSGSLWFLVRWIENW